MLDRIRGGLIVSIQPEADSVLNTPELVAVLARCAQANGAVAVRIEGIERIAAVRAAVALPIVGLVKRTSPGFEPYITTSNADIEAIVTAGAEIVALDGTSRARAGGATVETLIEAAHDRGALALADCAASADARTAAGAGADAIATTLFGYTPDTRATKPPGFGLIREAVSFHPFVVCEGGLSTPAEVQRAFSAGASAVCIGTAISNIDALIRHFAQAALSRRTL